MTLVAPAGTPIVCGLCGETVATLVNQVARGQVIRAEDVELADGREPVPGLQVACGSCGNTMGFHAVIDGEQWNVWH